ncbi:hypothetical protein KY290_027306 [Solanum tuberosum]|uniref:Uncharacterized protein n=2 Tax=Solanum tuberosum TaxID=4113 RepID=A0ABQ7UGB6_SOLTU|nr:hypothetical protein KY290_027306 [Solanum tuberosum]
MTAPLSTCTTTCVGLSGMNIFGSYYQKNLNPEGLFILISGGIRCIIYGMKQRKRDCGGKGGVDVGGDNEEGGGGCCGGDDGGEGGGITVVMEEEEEEKVMVMVAEEEEEVVVVVV